MFETTKRTGYLLKRAQSAFRLKMDDALAGLEISTAQYAVLAALDEAPGLSNAELARRSFVTPQTMIRIVSDLENRQLIERQPRSTNARVLAATITGDGESRLARAHTLVADIESTMMAGMGASEAKALQRLLTTVAENLESS